jgi:hypothetical protein
MTTFVQARARSRWRITITFDGSFAGWTTSTTYAIARADGAPTSVTVSRAFATDSTTIELALSEALLEDVVYALSATAVTGSTSVAVQSAPTEQTPRGAIDDPEAEAFGVDVDWLAPSLDATGDIPTIRGRECLRADLIAIAFTAPGELFHRPDAGAGIPDEVNGPAELDDLIAATKREWQRDDRINRLEPMRAEISTAGEVSIRAIVIPIAIDEPLPVSVNRG